MLAQYRQLRIDGRHQQCDAMLLTTRQQRGNEIGRHASRNRERRISLPVGRTHFRAQIGGQHLQLQAKCRCVAAKAVHQLIATACRGEENC